jgi:hypothetical protein
MKEGKAEDYNLDEYGTVWLKDRICVPQDKELLEQIMKEAHDSRFSIHPGSTKNVQRFEDKVLVEGHEERYSSLRGLL